MVDDLFLALFSFCFFTDFGAAIDAVGLVTVTVDNAKSLVGFAGVAKRVFLLALVLGVVVVAVCDVGFDCCCCGGGGGCCCVGASNKS